MNRQTERRLCVRDDANRSKGQTATRIEQLMVSHHHPWAAEYLQYLHFFELLPYASQPASRFVSYVDDDNCIELGRPVIGLAAQPCPADPREMVEGDGDARRRVLAAAAAGWQTDSAPDFVRGLWIVRSTDRLTAHRVEGVSRRIESIRFKDRYVARLFRPTREEFTELLDIARICQPEGLLADSSPPDPADECEQASRLVLRDHDLAWWADRRDAWV